MTKYTSNEQDKAKILEVIREDGSKRFSGEVQVPTYRGIHPYPFHDKVLYVYSNPNSPNEWYEFWQGYGHFCRQIQEYTGKCDEDGVALYKKIKVKPGFVSLLCSNKQQG